LQIRTDNVTATGDLFGVTALDEDFTPINQMIKYFKYGFGRTTDYVNEEIRIGRMTRNQGIKLVERFDDNCSPDYISRYCDYLEISVELFWDKVRESCDLRLFAIKEDGTIKRKFEVGVGI